jgi:uncharacterized iron-regulated protein
LIRQGKVVMIADQKLSCIIIRPFSETLMKTAIRPSAICLLLLLFAAGCATTRESGDTAEMPEEPTPATLPHEMVILGADGAAATWDTVVARASAADIIVLAEQHDDPLAHRFQAALTGALVAKGKVAVCMEMFERDEQPLVDAYLAGEIAQKTLVDVTDSKDWGAKGKWDEFYQPIVDAAKAGASPVIAANAPRRFVRIARLEGFEGLAAFAGAYPAQFVVPAPIDEAAYFERFKATMSHHSAPPAKGTKAEAHAMPAMTDEQFEAIFRAQQVWDATMADSVINAWRVHGKAMLMVGQFHTDHDGGLLLRMKAAAPEAKYLTISLDKAEAATLAEEDKGRADFVVYRPVAEK